MAEELVRPYSKEEIRVALFQMAPMKASGVDGYPTLFYQRHWNLVGDDLYREINSFLKGGQLDQIRWNVTRVVLVPNVKNARKLEDFRPISVCNTLMKLISKALANKIKVSYLRTRKGTRKKIMSLKLDMSKAYDRIEWQFLEKILTKFGFPSRWVMKCVTTVSYKIKEERDQIKEALRVTVVGKHSKYLGLPTVILYKVELPGILIRAQTIPRMEEHLQDQGFIKPWNCRNSRGRWI
ncbi:hypothetical protein QQ045_004627 [Rhodiola kirilowii]